MKFHGTMDQRVRWGYKHRLLNYHPEFLEKDLLQFYDGVWRENTWMGNNGYGSYEYQPSTLSPETSPKMFHVGTAIGFTPDGQVLVRSDRNEILVLPVQSLQAL